MILPATIYARVVAFGMASAGPLKDFNFAAVAHLLQPQTSTVIARLQAAAPVAITPKLIPRDEV